MLYEEELVMCFSVDVETNLEKISKIFNATKNKDAYEYFEHLKMNEPKKYKYPNEQDPRIFTKTWAPLICKVRGKLEIRPMRYQLLPSFCKNERYTRINPQTGREQEIKNTFNARLDALTNAKAWQKPFMRQHAIIVIKRFYEWVERENKKVLVAFTPQSEYHIAPCLYDTWYSEDKKLILQSFAIITTDPNPEVQAVGHDRTPINLQKKFIDQWLSPELYERDTILKSLTFTNNEKYNYEFIE